MVLSSTPSQVCSSKFLFLRIILFLLHLFQQCLSSFFVAFTNSTPRNLLFSFGHLVPIFNTPCCSVSIDDNGAILPEANGFSEFDLGMLVSLGSVAGSWGMMSWSLVASDERSGGSEEDAANANREACRVEPALPELIMMQKSSKGRCGRLLLIPCSLYKNGG